MDEFFGFTEAEWEALMNAPETVAARAERKAAERAATRDCGPEGVFGFTEAEWHALHDEADEA